MKKTWFKFLSAVLIFNLTAYPLTAEDFESANIASETSTSVEDGETADVAENEKINSDESTLTEAAVQPLIEAGPDEEEEKKTVNVTFIAYPNNIEAEYGQAVDAWTSIEGTEAHLTTSNRTKVLEVEKGVKLSELKVVGLAGSSEFLGWFTAQNGGEAVPGDTVIDSDRTYYAHFRLPMPKMTADAGSYGYFEQNGSELAKIDFHKEGHGVFNSAKVYDSNAPADDGDRVNYNIPRPEVKDGYELIGYHYYITVPTFKRKTSTHYVSERNVDIIFSHPKWQNAAVHGLSKGESLHVTYMYGSSDLKFILNIENVPLILKDEDVRLVSTDGSEFTGKIELGDNNNYKWVSDAVIPEGEYTVEILPEAESLEITGNSNGVDPSITDDGKLTVTISKLPLEAERIPAYELDVSAKYTAVPSENLTIDTQPTVDPAVVTSTTTETTETTKITETTETTKESVTENSSTTTKATSAKPTKSNKPNMAKTGESTSKNMAAAFMLAAIAVALIVVKSGMKNETK